MTALTQLIGTSLVVYGLHKAMWIMAEPKGGRPRSIKWRFAFARLGSHCCMGAALFSAIFAIPELVLKMTATHTWAVLVEAATSIHVHGDAAVFMGIVIGWLASLAVTVVAKDYL